MKNNSLIVIIAALAVVICLIITVLIFYAIKPALLIRFALAIGFISGVCATLIVINIINNFRNKKQ